MNTDISSNFNFTEAISKLCNDLVRNFHKLRDEFINVKNMIIKKLQDENAQLNDTIASLQHKVTILEIVTNSVGQNDWINNIEITGIPDRAGNKSLEQSVIEVFKAVDIKISYKNIEDYLGHF